VGHAAGGADAEEYRRMGESASERMSDKGGDLEGRWKRWS
jgi:hypothetical protein